MASPTPLGVHQVNSNEPYALVEDLNWVGITADAAIAFVKARAEYLTDKAVTEAGELSRRALDEARALSQRALNELPGLVDAEVDRVIGDTREDAAEARDLAERAYEYNQALVAPAADVVNAIVTDPATPAGALVGSKVSVGDTYVGVTRQAGATMKDKLHAACKEASRVGGVVMLPSTPIDVGAGFSMAGYSCGIVGQPVGVRRPVSTPAFIEGAGLVASQHAGPVLDFRGFQWRNAYEGRVPFRDFHLRGNDVVDPTRTNVGLYIGPGESSDGKYRSLHAGAGLVDFDLTISGCGGGGVYANKFYFTRSRFDISTGTGTGPADVPAAIFENATGADVKMNIFSPVKDGTQVVGPSGLVRVTAWTPPNGGEPIRSNISRWDVAVENFHMTSGSTLVHLQACANEVQMTLQDILPAGGKAVSNTSAVRIVKPPASATLSNGANLVHGHIPGTNSPLTFTHPIWVQDSGNAVVGSREYGTHNVVIDPGVTGTYVNLRGAYGTPTSPGIVDNSGKPGENTLLDFPWYPEDGRNPSPARLRADLVKTSSSGGWTDESLPVYRFAKNALYQFTARVDYTASPSTHATIGVQSSDSTAVIESWTVEGIPMGGTNTPTRQSGSGNGSANLAGLDTRSTAIVTGTFRTADQDPKKFLRVWAAQRSSSTTNPMTVHAGSFLKVERIA